MKLTESRNVLEEDEDRDFAIVRCPVCKTVWFDEQDDDKEIYQVPKQTCRHLMFTLTLFVEYSSEDSHELKINGNWDSRTFRQNIRNAFRRRKDNWKEKLSRIECPGVDDVVFYVDDVIPHLQVYSVYAFGLSRQEDGAVAQGGTR